ncbi:Cadherin [Halocaridina rubra]|uniref:Cadherin n=1 Tax=Halocaridina rubra TaxID=373956 RepID=A0AAN8ZXK1_HALRR
MSHKGTGTVLVEVSDVNDVPPRFSKPEWFLDISEKLTPENILATLTVIDQDISNNFTYRVIPGSGKGWEMFQVKGRVSGAPGGDLHVMQPLDYENEDHRKGFKFKVQVSDMGEEGWSDKYHVDSAWVNLCLVDANDNAPIFIRDHTQLTLPENTPRGTLLATFTANDRDGGGRSKVRYSVDPASDPSGIFGVNDTNGTVRLNGSLDREKNTIHTVLILATDDGAPPRTTTATLVIDGKEAENSKHEQFQDLQKEKEVWSIEKEE